MSTTAERTIRYLGEQRAKAEQGRREALLQVAEMKHELELLRHMRIEIMDCLAERKLKREAGAGSASSLHAVSKIARVIRNAK